MSPLSTWLVQTTQELSALHNEKKYRVLADTMLEKLREISAWHIVSIPAEEEKIFNLFTTLVLKIFSEREFTIPDDLAIQYIEQAVLISNLASISNFKNTDLVLKLLMEQQAALPKILTLYSFRNEISFDVEKLFAVAPRLMGVWWTRLLLDGQRCTANKTSFERRKMLLKLKGIKTYPEFISRDNFLFQGGFHSTYIDDTQDRYVKTALNAAMKKVMPSAPPPKTPDFHKILVITHTFNGVHAVYKTISSLIATLKGHYELVLVDLMPKPVPAGHDFFDRVIPAPRDDLEKLVGIISGENAGMIIYPDIGMDALSTGLATQRLAPIQLTTYGHPVSTYSDAIDYFIVSKDAELIPELKNNYSERAVLLPGLAAVSHAPDYTLTHPLKSPEHMGKIIINCAWGNMKLQYPMVPLLKKILDRAESDIVFSFTDIRPQILSYIPFTRDLEAALGKEHIVHFPLLPYGNYMNIIEQGDFALDSYPFCGFNRTVDTLHCGKPIITLEGRKVYNRFGSTMLRQLGLSELVAANEEEYVALAVRMADDAAYRGAVAQRVRDADLHKVLFNNESVKYFKPAIDYLVANHEALKKDKSRKPIVIDEVCEVQVPVGKVSAAS